MDSPDPGAPMRRLALAALLCCIAPGGVLLAQDSTGVKAKGDSVAIRFVEADMRAVVQALAPYLSKPLLTANLPGDRVTLQTPAPVAREDVLALLRGLAEAHNLRLTEDSAYFRLGPPPAPEPAPPQAAPVT